MENPYVTPNEPEEIISHPYDWTIDDAGDSSNEYDAIELRAWTLDKESNPYLLRFRGFPCFCHVELPAFVNRKKYKWHDTDVAKIVRYLQYVLKDKGPFNGKLIHQQKLYYYNQRKKYPFIRLYFHNMNSMRACENLLKTPREVLGKNKGFVACKVWEVNIPPVRKLLTIQKGHFSQWFKITGRLVPDDERISKLDREYICDWSLYKEIPMEETTEWITNPRIMSFDIEAYSDNHNCFPNKYSGTDIAFMVSCIFQRYKMPETREGYTLIIGDCNMKTVNGTIIACENETDLRHKMEQLIIDKDPEIVMGYNIFGFDYEYLDERRKISTRENWGCIGRIHNKLATVRNVSWASGAYGSQDLNILEMDGRISIDMLPVIKRDYKLSKYDLNTVGKHFLGRGKHDVSAKEMFITYKRLMDIDKLNINGKNIKDICQDILGPIENTYNPGDINCILTDDTEKREENRKTTRKLVSALRNIDLVDRIRNQDGYVTIHPALVNIWISAPQEDGNLSEDMTNIWLRIQDLIKQDEYSIEELSLYISLICEYYDVLDAMTKIQRYCYEDSCLCPDIFDEINGWVSLLMMSSVVGVTISEVFTRGQQIRVISQLYNLCAKTGYVMDCKPASDFSMSGGYVADPIVGIHEPVPCIDFNSLYPSIIMAYNICFTSFIPPELDAIIPDEMCHIIEWDDTLENENGEEYTVHHRYRFIKQEYHLGLIPRIVKELVHKRKEVRSKIKTAPSQLLKLVYNCLQLALKVAANSVFGFLSTKNGKYPLIEAGMSVTAKGRELIQDVNKFCIEKWNADIVYGDSVTGNTPILIRPYSDNTEIQWISIKDLVHIPNKDKNKIRIDLEDNIEIWSDQGWTKIKRFIRHWTDKDIYKISSSHSVVEVTSDHSLLRPDGTEVRPTDVRTREELMHSRLPKCNLENIQIDFVRDSSRLAFAKIIHKEIMEDKHPDSNTVHSIENLGPCNNYVYDLETENHHFSAGIGEIVVHNTDSTMPDLHITDPSKAWEISDKLAEEVSALFPEDIVMENEKVMRIFTIKKKMYAYLPVGKDGRVIEEIDKIFSKGLLTARRDNCQWMREFYKDVLFAILCLKNMDEVFDIILYHILRLVRRQVDLYDLTIIRSVGASYKNDTYFMKVFADELRALGKPVAPGERLDYVIVKTDPPERLMGKRMRLPETFVERLNSDNPEIIDYEYYINNLMMKRIELMFNARFGDQIKELEEKYSPKARNRLYTRLDSKPVKMIMNIIEAKNSVLQELRTIDIKAILSSSNDINNSNISTNINNIVHMPIRPPIFRIINNK